MSNSKLILTFILFFAAFLRLYGLSWDQGHYLHPDERLYVNASSLSLPKSLQEFLSPDSPLNPNMFYYGSFPLYFYKIIHIFFFPTSSFLITSRLVSSILSIATIPLIFLIGKELFSKKIGLLAAFVFAFSPGSIQHAHFNTTESWLVFFLASITLLSIKAIKKKNYRFFIPLGILTGMSYATKIAGLTFILLPALSLAIFFLKEKNRQKTILWALAFLLLTILTGAIAAPYQIIDFAHFWREQEFMQGVTLGKYKPPFIIIYEGTLPYLYPFIKILPFTFGFVSFLLAAIGLIKIIKGTTLSRLFLNIFPLLYFLWAGAWYAKFSRYYILLLPFLSLWAALALASFKRVTLFIVLFFIALNGLLFLRVYLQPHTRIQASQWIYNHLPTENTLACEHWDDCLPLPITTVRPWYFGLNKTQNQSPTLVESYKTLELPVYDEPDDETKITRLSQLLNRSDYFVLTSRRVYYSILRNPVKYPFTSRFYELLFAEKLGFKLVKKFTNYPYFFSDDFADETFQSYDHPPVLIFKNENKYSAEQLKTLMH